MRVVQGCLDWLLKNVKSAEDSNSEIQLLPLDALGYELYESPPKSLNQCYLLPGTNKYKMVKPKPPFIPQNPITNSAQFTRILEAPQRAFYTEIACPHHQTVSEILPSLKYFKLHNYCHCIVLLLVAAVNEWDF